MTRGAWQPPRPDGRMQAPKLPAGLRIRSILVSLPPPPGDAQASYLVAAEASFGRQGRGKEGGRLATSNQQQRGPLPMLHRKCGVAQCPVALCGAADREYVNDGRAGRGLLVYSY